MQQQKIAFIGAGNMTRSIISGLVAKHYPSDLIMAANPTTTKLDNLKQQYGVNTTINNNEAIEWADIVVLAVKPQLMASVCQAITVDVSNKLFVSLAAGICIESYFSYFEQKVPLIRVMPNTPSLLGLGMSGLYASDDVGDNDKAIITQLMASVGQTLWVEKESHIDLVTACSGSSPAYFFLMMEYMQQSAVNMGLTGEEARLLIQQAALGAAEMVRHNDHLELSELRKQVTSKGGTTHAAIETFKEQGFESMVDNAMKNAVKRADEMAKEF